MNIVAVTRLVSPKPLCKPRHFISSPPASFFSLPVDNVALDSRSLSITTRHRVKGSISGESPAVALLTLRWVSAPSARASAYPPRASRTAVRRVDLPPPGGPTSR